MVRRKINRALFGPCFNVGHCNRDICPCQHEDDKDDIEVTIKEQNTREWQNKRCSTGGDEKKRYTFRRRSNEGKRICGEEQVKEQMKPGKEFMATGLRNLGNSCYINAVIQALISVTPFSENMMQLKENNKEKRTEGKLTRELEYLIQDLKAGERKDISPGAFIETVKNESNSRFGNGMQEDAHEFLLYVLEKIHEESMDHGSGNSIVDRIFTGEAENINKCIKCRQESRKRENFDGLFVNIPTHRRGKIMLEDCISYTEKEEMIEARCDYANCQNGEHAKKRVITKRYPEECLIITLKRFRKGGLEKIRKVVDVPFRYKSMELKYI